MLKFDIVLFLLYCSFLSVTIHVSRLSLRMPISIQCTINYFPSAEFCFLFHLHIVLSYHFFASVCLFYFLIIFCYPHAMIRICKLLCDLFNFRCFLSYIVFLTTLVPVTTAIVLSSFLIWALKSPKTTITFCFGNFKQFLYLFIV